MSVTKNVLYLGEVNEFIFEIALEGVNIILDDLFIDKRTDFGQVSIDTLPGVIEQIVSEWGAELA